MYTCTHRLTQQSQKLALQTRIKPPATLAMMLDKEMPLSSPLAWTEGWACVGVGVALVDWCGLVAAQLVCVPAGKNTHVHTKAWRGRRQLAWVRREEGETEGGHSSEER